jgi:predicted RNase H-like HicB family nuclease
MNKIVVTLERADTGYCAYVPEFDFCGTVGDNLEEIRRNLVEAITLYLDDDPMRLASLGFDTEDPVPFDFRMDVSVFFQLHNPIKQSRVAKMAGINPSLLRQYARGIKHPGLNQARKIEKAIHQLGRELLRVRF